MGKGCAVAQSEPFIETGPLCLMNRTLSVTQFYMALSLFGKPFIGGVFEAFQRTPTNLGGTTHRGSMEAARAFILPRHGGVEPAIPGVPACATKRCRGFRGGWFFIPQTHSAMGQKPTRPPSEHPNPTEKGSKMGGASTNGVDNHSLPSR